MTIIINVKAIKNAFNSHCKRNKIVGPKVNEEWMHFWRELIKESEK